MTGVSVCLAGGSGGTVAAGAVVAASSTSGGQANSMRSKLISSGVSGASSYSWSS